MEKSIENRTLRDNRAQRTNEHTEDHTAKKLREYRHDLLAVKIIIFQ